ncbi:hypothetical protein HPB51_024249 [Rhipicephalus microplus]|uniref:Tick transposon n=1 Tax=Rhipicephalus microplus TaxID=6941 RepID=A0A9J6DXH3_RHIMP|nr:hypothetical protein HPB51_024249 [Rhipicephalus microplus]
MCVLPIIPMLAEVLCIAAPIDTSARVPSSVYWETLCPLHYQRASLHAEPSWKAPSWTVVALLPGFKSKRRTSGPALRHFTLEHLENCYRARHIYTDGSVTSTSSAIGVWIPSANVTISATLSHYTSSTATEQAALRAAINYIVDQTAEFSVIFTDSRAALQSLRSPCTQDQLAMEHQTPMQESL